MVEVAVLGSRGDDTISDLPRGYEVSLNGGPGNDTITAHDSSTTIVEGVDPGRSLPLGRGTYRIGQEFAGQDPGRSNRYRRTATENGRGDNLGGFILNGGGGTVTAGPGWDNLRIAGNSTHRINLGAGRGDVEVQGKATHGPITASTGADVRYFRDLGSSRSAVKINASKGTVAVSGTNGFKNLGTVRRVTDWTLRTRGALTFTGTSRADQLTARAQLLTARLYEGNDKVTAVMLAKKGTSINGGKGRDTARLRLQKGKKQVKFKATLISVEIRR